jgi:hypothetical protein
MDNDTAARCHRLPKAASSFPTPDVKAPGRRGACNLTLQRRASKCGLTRTAPLVERRGAPKSRP